MSRLTVTLYDAEEDTEQEHALPACWQICDSCRGSGSHVNPAVDGNGISREDFDEDPEFKEAYFAGRYDVPCDCCNGSGKVLVPDEANMTPAQRVICERWQVQQQDRARWDREDAYTRRMENGGY